MKILFVGEGLTDYVVQKLNKLNQTKGVEVYNVADADGAGHVPASVHQTREGINFKVVELFGVMRRKYGDYAYRSFEGLDKAVRDIHPDVIMVSLKYLKAFLYDLSVARARKEIGAKLITNDNPYKMELYTERKKAILSGGRDGEYAPFYIVYFLRLWEILGMKDTWPLRRALMNFLRWTGMHSRRKNRAVLLERLEETKNILNAADAHVSYIERAYEIYGSYGVPREKIFIKYNSPDTDILFEIREKIEKEPPILAPNPHRLIHVGRLAPYKKVDMLIRAFAEVKREFVGGELLVVGQGPEEKKLKALAEELGLADSVRFTGWADQADMGRYLLASSVYVLAGHGGLSINDGMAFGRPVVCSVGDGTERHLVFEGLNGTYFKNDDQRDLAEKIRRLLRDPELLYRMGEHSTEIIRHKVNIHIVLNAYLKACAYALAH